MKKIDFEVFGPGQYLYFDIGRLIQVENITGKSAGDIIRNQELNLGILTALLSRNIYRAEETDFRACRPESGCV